MFGWKNMINKPLSDKLLLFLQQYLSFYTDFLQLEADKYSDISQSHISQLDERVNTEEAYMLKSRGLEMERARLWEEAGSPEATFLELIPLFDPSVQEQAKGIYKELLQVLYELKETNLRCNHLTELKLHRIEVDIQKLKKHPELQKQYDSKAAREGYSLSGVLSKKI
jgi:hypothetical protein